MCSFYRIFISNFSKICALLTDLYSGKHKPSKHQRLVWKETHQKAFELLKDKMTSAPVLAHFEDGLETRIHVDSSGAACGAVLTQKHEQGYKPVSFCSVPSNVSAPGLFMPG